MNKSIEHIGQPVVRAGIRQPISAAVAVGELVFVSGQVPMANGKPCAPDIEGQTSATLNAIEAILAQAGCTLADVVKVNVWLTDKTDYPGFNAVYAQRFAAGATPARSTVVALLIAPVKVEIDVIACRPRALPRQGEATAAQACA